MRISRNILLLCLLSGGCARNPQPPLAQLGSVPTALPAVEQRSPSDDGTSARRTDDPPKKNSARARLTRLRSQNVAATRNAKSDVTGTLSSTAKLEAGPADAAERNEAKTAIVGSIAPLKEGTYEDAVREQDQRLRQWDRKAAAAVRSICGSSKTC